MIRLEWETILRFMGASADEITDARLRIGPMWR
jgi:hypothetical protein